jgi:hypothetical protein
MVVCLSIDVGIKNLAFCLLEKTEEERFHILKWSIIDLSQSEDLNQTCQFIDKKKGDIKEKGPLKGELCGKEAKYKKNGSCYCVKHSKKQTYQIPSQDLNPTFLNKQRVQKLQEIAKKYSVTCEKGMKKAQILEALNEYSHTKCFEVIEKKNASKVGLITIGRNIKSKFDTAFSVGEAVNKIDTVVIENQISPIATRMKTIQGMVAQYFIMNDMTENIEFVSSINKLKEFKVVGTGIDAKAFCEEEITEVDEVVEANSMTTNTTSINDKTTIINGKTTSINDKKKYKERKNLGIEKTRELIQNMEECKDFLDFFNKNTKKDDLADCFLQGYWYMNKK